MISKELMEALLVYSVPVVFILLALLQTTQPRRVELVKGLQRWISNGILLLTDQLLMRAATYAFLAVFAGLVNEASFEVSLLSIPVLVLFFLLLDFADYLFHRLLHHYPLLWRVHRIHHSDIDLDITTAFRFHPGEALLSLAWKAAFIFLFSIPDTTLYAYSVFALCVGMFSHANVQLNESFDRFIRLVLVTPGMHQIHHANNRQWENSNYGINLSCWDRLFGSYKALSLDEQQNIVFGNAGLGENRNLSTTELFLLPFTTKSN